jgi:hypothetical protein
MSEVMYELKTPIQYSHKGDKVDATFISLTAPTFKQLDKFAPMKQMIANAMLKIRDSVDESTIKEVKESQEDDTDDLKFEGKQALNLLYTSETDMASFFIYAQELFKSGAALVEGESKLTVPLMDQMDASDFEGLVGEYVANFIMPSLMDGQ